MAYIYLDDLKKILPGILDSWIDKDDESWEWIFQEIEQKCRVGKKSKKKKKVSKIDAIEIAIMAHRNDINELNKKYDELSNKISNLGDRHTVMAERVNKMHQDITAAKSMAEIAKNRTETDYSKISSSNPTGSVDWAKAQEIMRVCEINGITGPEHSSLYSILSKYVKNYRLKENIIKDCLSCKHYCGDGVIKEPCIGCENRNCWEAKDE